MFLIFLSLLTNIIADCPPPGTLFNVTGTPDFTYVFDTAITKPSNNQVLRLTRGCVYNFTVTYPANLAHPFHIVTNSQFESTQSGLRVAAPGAVKNGCQPSGCVVDYVVPACTIYDAANCPTEKIHWQCEYHENMFGDIELYFPVCPYTDSRCLSTNQCKQCDSSCGGYCQNTASSVCGPSNCITCPAKKRRSDGSNPDGSTCIDKLGTITTSTITPDDIVVTTKQQVKFQAQVKKAHTTDTPLLTGKVIFQNDADTSINSGLIDIDSNGHASWLHIFPDIQMSTYSAVYQGNDDYLSSKSSPSLVLTVQTAAVNVQCNINTKYFTINQEIPAFAGVFPAGQAYYEPTGTVSFWRGNTKIAGSGGFLYQHQNMSKFKLPAGVWGISARYAGDTHFNAANSPPTTITVLTKANSKATLTIPKKTVSSTKKITFTVWVQSLLVTNLIASGRVNFYNKGVNTGRFATLNSTGVATYTGKFAKGTYQITGHYVGNLNLNPSVSNAITIHMT